MTSTGRVVNNGRAVEVRSVRNDSGEVYELIFTEKAYGVNSRRQRTEVVARFIKGGLDGVEEIIALWIADRLLPA